MLNLFNKRMNLILERNGALGGRLIDESDYIKNKTFTNDRNYQKGKIYDWDMNYIDDIEFSFEKHLTHRADQEEIEYYVHFRPNVNPEFEYMNLYYKQDKRERFGFYIDVYDYQKNIYEKWLIVNKDDRVAFDRYNAYKCNWCLEWVTHNKYHNCLAVIRDAKDSSMKNLINDSNVGGTTINDEMSVILPSNQRVNTIKLGHRFIISDNINNPQVYEAVKIKDTSPLGTTQIYLKERLFNPHTDFSGKINDLKDWDFVFDLPIPNLPTGFGDNYHNICDCITSKGLPPIETDESEELVWKLESSDKYVYVNGTAVTVNATKNIDTEEVCDFHIYIDNVEYQIEDLTDYFDISISPTSIDIACTNKNMVGYIVSIKVFNNSNSDTIEMEVKL